jgi:hypothetical protein
VRFTGLVHEQVQPQLEAALFTIVTSSIMIAHMGYIATREDMLARFERNVKLLSAQVATSDHAKDYYLQMLQRALFTLNDYQRKP